MGFGNVFIYVKVCVSIGGQETAIKGGLGVRLKSHIKPSTCIKMDSVLILTKQNKHRVICGKSIKIQGLITILKKLRNICKPFLYLEPKFYG